MALFTPDQFTVHTEIINIAPSVDAEIAVRFVEAPFGIQKHNGKKGWYCGYIAMRDEDFGRISDKLAKNRGGYPEFGAPGGTTYYNKAPPFDDGMHPRATVLGWDYDHRTPLMKFTTKGSVIGDARACVRYMRRLFEE